MIEKEVLNHFVPRKVLYSHAFKLVAWGSFDRKRCQRSEYTTLEFKYLVAQQTIEQLQKKLKEDTEKIKESNSGWFSI